MAGRKRDCVRPIENDETDLDREEREKQERLERAVALLETHPAYHGVQAELWDASQELERLEPLDSFARNTDQRLERMIKSFDLKARLSLKLATDLNFHKAYTVLLGLFMEESWLHYSSYQIFMVPPPQPGFAPQHEQIKVKRFWGRRMHWTYEAHRQIAQLNRRSAAPERRGYRAEVLDWMARKGISTVDIAAKRLGVSKSALKSIMSAKGQKRYGDERLADILRQIIVSDWEG